MPMVPISRRRLLLAGSAGALAACSHKKATGFQGYCFVASQISRTVTAIDLTSFKVRGRISLDAEPTLVLPHPTATKVYVLAPAAGTVYEIDGAKFAVSRKARVGSTALQMQLSPAGDRLWVLYKDPAALVEIPLDTFRPRHQVALHTPATTFALSDAGGMAAIARASDRTISLVATDTGNITRTTTLAEEPSIMAFRKDGEQLLVGSRPARMLTILETGACRVVSRLPLPLEPENFVFNSDKGQLFISGPGMDAVVQVYPYRTEIAETMLAGRAPAGMAVTTTPSFLLVTNPETNSLTILDFTMQGRKLIASVQVGTEPRSVLVTPDQQYALVLNEKSGDVAVVRLTPLASQDFTRRYRPTAVFNMIPVGEKPVSAAVVGFA